MDLWLAYREALTLPWHEYRYEDLVEDFEGVLGGLLAFTGLDWHEDVARFRDLDHGQVIATPSYRQVTREIYKGSVGRWRSCAEFLAPVRATLDPYVAEFGYPEA